jgi:hypothetical protein
MRMLALSEAKMLKAEGSAVWAFGGEIIPKLGRKSLVAVLACEYRSPTFRRKAKVG